MLENNHRGLRRGNVFGDIKDIDMQQLAKAFNADPLYLLTAGFPCQPFSMEGYGLGTDDQAQGSIIEYVLEGIKAMLPRGFLLENVEGLMSSHLPTLLRIISNIKKIKGPRFQGYNVYYKILDSRTTSGIPHSRRRLFIVGIWKVLDEKFGGFKWPADVLASDPLDKFLDPDKGTALPATRTALANYTKCLEKVGGPNPVSTLKKGNYVGDLMLGLKRNVNLMANTCPCMTRQHAGGNYYWSFSRNRYLNSNELMKLQGIEQGTARLVNPPQVSDRQVKMMGGNSMDVKTVARIFIHMFKAMGFSAARLRDPV